MLQKQKHILDKVKTIVKHHKELAKAKGEVFNIYNILNVKTKEVRTHSAFIAELLNPNGSHFMGNKFLNEFINLMDNEVFKNHLDITSTTVKIEFSIGPIDVKKKTGGRIDIFLKDNYNKTISIENKIDADDQDNQIERYYNYNQQNNKVIYLSKFGEEPSEKSKGELIANTHFYVISYQNHIINWLESCQTIASDQPILRESIKQYKILIKQITNTLGNQENIELTKVVSKNLEEASVISSKYQQVVKKLKENLRNKVIKKIEDKTDGFLIKNNHIDNKHAHIWFHNNELEGTKEVWFGVESFSGKGHQDGLLFVGIFDKHNRLNPQVGFNAITKSWIHHLPILFDNIEVNLSNILFLNTISDSEKLDLAAEEIANQIVDFINDYRHHLENN